MQSRQAWPDGLDTSVRALRSPSISSEVPSTSAKSTNTLVPHANPPPAYIAHAGASNLVSTELDRTVETSPQALILVNEFLDHVLFNILSTSRSVSLSTLRAAVPSVLKPRLGKAAVRVAEEDMKEYLEDEEELELNSKKSPMEARSNFDLELAWKLARLRCMVYAQLGDLEEEDEEEWLEKEQLLVQADNFRAETNGEIELGPASAIFLASVIEYLGQQALLFAAQYSVRRYESSKHQSAGDPQASATLTPMTDEIILEGKDMNHVGRESPLSRLWRSWRRNTRDGGSGFISPDAILSPVSPPHSRKGSQVPVIRQIAEETLSDQAKSPSQVPLPLTENDIDEIEVPGLASAISDSEDDTPEIPDRSTRRPASMIAMPGAYLDSYQYDSSDDAEPEIATPREPVRPTYGRKRSSSAPNARLSSFMTFKSSKAVLDEEAVDVQPEEGGTESTTPAPVSPGLATRRTQIPNEPASPNKRDGMVGGGLAAAVGALGAGAAAITGVGSKDDVEAETPREIRRESPVPVPAPKQTAAESMLGHTGTVSSPKDATTGASITNVTDFDSMYVPVEMPPADASNPLPHQDPRGDVDEQNVPISRKPVAGTVTTESVAARSDTSSNPANNVPTTTLTPAPAAPPSTHKRSVSSLDTKALPPPPPIEYPADSPVSPEDVVRVGPVTSTAHHRVSYEPTYRPKGQPQYNQYADHQAQHPQTIVEDPYMNNTARHAHAGSQTSFHSHQSKSSSSSSRLLGFTRDAAGRPHTMSQQYTEGAPADYTHASQSSAPPNIRDGRPSTANSSTGPKSFVITQEYQRSNDAEQKKKSLEVLIQSDETLHYTLTPTTAMVADENLTPTRRTETQDMADFIRNTGPPGPDSRAGKAPIANVQYPSQNLPPSRPLVVEPPPRKKGFIPSSRNYPQMAPSPNRRRNPMGEARDPRAEGSMTMRDLADYARSTGPMYESQLPKPLTARGANSTTPQPAASPRAQNINASANRQRYQARDARPRGDDNSDLIDFIREGPPRQQGEHRIDRRVAPFRTTMDSEDLNSMAPNVEDSPAGHSGGSTQDGRSTEYSVNSTTGLLNSNQRSANGAGNYGSSSYGASSNDLQDNGMPKRTRRRVKDPYAIDYSDDEDSDEPARAQRPNNNEESLIDFLRNTAPPPGMAPQPVLASIPVNTATYNSSQRPADAKRGYNLREESPHLTQQGSKMDSYRPTQATHASHVDRNRGKPRVEARDPRSARTDTSDLADFFNNSAPPPPVSTQPRPVFSAPVATEAQREGNGLFRSLTKRKGR